MRIVETTPFYFTEVLNSHVAFMFQVYIPGLPTLYGYMLKQRKKMLGGAQVPGQAPSKLGKQS